MQVLALVFLVVAVTAAPFDEDPLALYRNYHESIGIPLATKIRAIEESKDFDGGNAPGRIYGGFPSPLGANPHVGGVLLYMNNGGTSVCGSALLNNKRVVTAAHCCPGIWQFEVVLGSTTLFYGGTRVMASEAIMHEDYNALLVTNDIALLKLDSIVVPDANIAFVALPIGNLLNNDFVGHRGTVAGFGMVGNSQITVNQILMQADFNVMANTACSAVYGSAITSNSLCASAYPDSSTCSGDSGGPLTVWNGNARVLVGVLSFHHREGCMSGHPIGFTRVTSYVTWIQKYLV